MLQPIDKWEICLHNKYPAYIAWDEFVANQAQLRANSLKYREEQPGVARKGQALLQGIVRCGRCGALFHLHYSGKQGEWPEYRCSADQSQFGGTDCQRVRALALDRQAEERFLQALQPDRVTLALADLAQLEQEEQAERQRKELEQLQKEGETKLTQFVREALDRTQGRPTKDDTAAANAICKRHRTVFACAGAARERVGAKLQRKLGASRNH